MKKISYPNIGNYSIPVNFLLKNISDLEIVKPKNNTIKTINLGEEISPDYICTPFKYTLGNYLENEADIYLQLGGGCKYGYYYELQEILLKKINPNKEIINLITKRKVELKRLYTCIKKISKKNIFIILYYSILTKIKISHMDYLEDLIRQIRNKNNFEFINKIYNNYLKTVENDKKIPKIYKNFISTKNQILNYKNENKIKIALIGELYTLMEPNANMKIEEYLNKKGVSISRNTNASFLLFKKKKFFKKNIKKSKYINTKMGADASENIILCEKYCDANYDAIIHIKSSFCTPEIGAMQILNKVAKDYDVPILFLSFDSNTSKTGLETRLEALIDVIEMRKKI